jgi:cellulose synthase/poly-beta-1,6-N-acetylglucosamine synthase-like glycosyltransferase
MTALVIFGASLAFMLYVIVVYPALLGAMARRRQRPVNKKPFLDSVTILIAVHNGERFIRDKLESVTRLDYPRDLLEVLLLCDGCTDSTADIAAAFSGVEVIRLARAGKAAALYHGIRRARGNIVLMTDVRQPLAPDSVRHLVANFADPTVGVASGDVIILAGDTQEALDIRSYWQHESWIRHQLSRIDSMFGANGTLYAMRRALMVPLPADILLDDVYQPLAAFFRGYRLIMDREAKAYEYPTPLSTEFHRKVRTLAGNYQLLWHYPQLLTRRNRLLGFYVSQKLGRLLLPHALGVAIFSSFFLPSPWRELAVAGEVAVCLLAAADRLLPQGTLAKRISSPLRTFVVMMAATFCAMKIFFIPAQQLWTITTNVGTAKGALDKDAQ